MSDITKLINRKAIYRGMNRRHLFGSHPITITNVRPNRLGEVGWVMLDGGENIGWVHIDSVEVLPEETPNYISEDAIDQIFTAASGGKEAVLDAEIARLEARLVELKTARKVLDSL